LFGKSLAIIALIFSFAFLILDGTDAFAAAHGGGGRKSAATGTVGLVLLNSTDGVAHWGQQVTFNVSTTATTEPHVGLKCSQSSVVVYRVDQRVGRVHRDPLLLQRHQLGDPRNTELQRVPVGISRARSRERTSPRHPLPGAPLRALNRRGSRSVSTVP